MLHNNIYNRNLPNFYDFLKCGHVSHIQLAAHKYIRKFYEHMNIFLQYLFRPTPLAVFSLNASY